jgi:hypothetical protein
MERGSRTPGRQPQGTGQFPDFASFRGADFRHFRFAVWIEVSRKEGRQEAQEQME